MAGAPVDDLAFGLRKRNAPVVHRGSLASGDGATWDGVERRHHTRRVRRRYRFIDRRRGFDRRRRYPLTGGLRDHPRVLVLVLVWLNLLSIADGLFTAAELEAGVASEGNPALVVAGAQHPLLAVALKLGGMLLATAIVWHGRERRVMLSIALAALYGFTALVAYHAGTLSGLGWW